MVIFRAFMIRVKANSQNVQVFGFIRLGRRPTIRNGMENGPRNATGKCRFCQHPLQIFDGGLFIKSLSTDSWSGWLTCQGGCESIIC